MPAEIYREIVNPDGENNPHSYALQMIGSGNRVLEVGCSVGYVTEALIRAGNTVVGIEIDPAAAIEAEQFAERVHVADLDLTLVSELESDMFDVALLGDVLEHLRDPAAALVDILKRVAAGGRVVISVPNIAHIDARIMLLEGRWVYQGTGLMDATHLRWFTKTSLRDLLTDAGLVATRVERVRIGRYGSDIELDTQVPRDDVLGYIESDPEAYTFQYVVEAVRRPENDGKQRPDLLADAPWDRPRLDHTREIAPLVSEVDTLRNRVTELENERDDLSAHLEAWEGSLAARVTLPLRRLRDRLTNRG